ncbi:hypothetical protein QBC40DRAFT_4495 [Triangularia verruculosa]|uniref:NECAP PHear domain-containing protein n=1 Tax=Triangularia verruculosa TaxID=2587418 RepID=A0AAN6XAA4_9PEZI|nr:hypothetical protein QBC40DRAFT_4495 [Triangularia verruculosa]
MEPQIDPATNQPLPPDAIVRVLHITPKVHIYTLPATTPSSSSYLAASWTSLPQNPIFTARLRILETSLSPESDSSPPNLKVDILLESTSTSSSSPAGTAQLFAAAPYTTPAIVTPCSDSSRFFALRVSDPSSGKKASLGIGFEERSDAFDFNLALQECAKSLGFGASGGQPQQQQQQDKKDGEDVKKDWSLKDGETITINLGGKFGRRQQQDKKEEDGGQGKSLNSFALPPPPGGGNGGGGFSLPPPPPSASEARRQKRLSAQQMGFDDGANGEFA